MKDAPIQVRASKALGWRGRLALAPLAGFGTFLAVFVGTEASVLLIFEALKVHRSQWAWLIPLTFLPLLLSAYSGYLVFDRLASHVEDG